MKKYKNVNRGSLSDFYGQYNSSCPFLLLKNMSQFGHCFCRTPNSTTVAVVKILEITELLIFNKTAFDIKTRNRRKIPIC